MCRLSTPHHHVQALMSWLPRTLHPPTPKHPSALQQWCVDPIPFPPCAPHTPSPLALPPPPPNPQPCTSYG